MNSPTLHTLESLIHFRTVANDQTFRAIFGWVGNHLWSEFKRYDFDVMRWYGSLDTENRQRFATWLIGEMNKAVQS